MPDKVSLMVILILLSATPLIRIMTAQYSLADWNGLLEKRLSEAHTGSIWEHYLPEPDIPSPLYLRNSVFPHCQSR